MLKSNEGATLKLAQQRAARCICCKATNHMTQYNAITVGNGCLNVSASDIENAQVVMRAKLRAQASSVAVGASRRVSDGTN